MKYIQKLLQWFSWLQELKHPYSHLNDWKHGLGFDDYGNPVYMERQQRKHKKGIFA